MATSSQKKYLISKLPMYVWTWSAEKIGDDPRDGAPDDPPVPGGRRRGRNAPPHLFHELPEGPEDEGDPDEPRLRGDLEQMILRRFRHALADLQGLGVVRDLDDEAPRSEPGQGIIPDHREGELPEDVGPSPQDARHRLLLEHPFEPEERPRGRGLFEQRPCGRRHRRRRGPGSPGRPPRTTSERSSRTGAELPPGRRTARTFMSAKTPRETGRPSRPLFEPVKKRT